MPVHPPPNKNNYDSQQDETDLASRQAQQQLIVQSQHLLQSIFDTSLIGMALHQAVRDEKGNILDFRILIVNKELERLTGRTDLVGKLYGEEFPGIKLTDLYTLMLKVMASGQPGQIEYNYPHDKYDNWFSSMFVKAEDGLVATNIDVTERRRAEAERINILAGQNQKVFWATIEAQETERKRIAEDLHNGLGQLLYGIKLSLEQLDLDTQPVKLDELKKVKQTTSQLLMEAIAESRRLSHELTPMILEDFGLKEALGDVCHQLGRSHGLTIECHFSGFFHRLSKPIQTAIYRTVQELVINVIKHAQATKAGIKVDVSHKAVIINVSDNGRGFAENHNSSGIGLKTIRNKVKLLNGKYSLTSEKDQDTIVTIRIPYIRV